MSPRAHLKEVITHGFFSSKCLQSREGCVTAPWADFNNVTLWKCVAYPEWVVRCAWCCETWRGNTGQLLKDDNSKQFCSGSVHTTARRFLGRTDPQNWTQALSQRELFDRLKKKEKKQSELTRKQGTGGWEHAGEISYLAFFMCPILILTESKQK